jgi:hypothetical protein
VLQARALGIPGFPVFGISGNLGFIVSEEGVRTEMSMMIAQTRPFLNRLLPENEISSYRV